MSAESKRPMVARNLKARNSIYIGAFLALNSLLTLRIALPGWHIPDLVTITNEPLFNSWLSRSGIAVLVALLITALNGLLPSGWKSIIVFWRFRNALPGHRAFSHIAKQDPRIDIATLTARMGVLPTAPRDQNSTWYKLFKKHESVTEISAEHGKFLLLRDLASLSLVLMPLAVPTLWLGARWSALGLLELALFIEFVLLVIPARHAGNRFVANVLARECC